MHGMKTKLWLCIVCCHFSLFQSQANNHFSADNEIDKFQCLSSIQFKVFLPLFSFLHLFQVKIQYHFIELGLLHIITIIFIFIFLDFAMRSFFMFSQTNTNTTVYVMMIVWLTWRITIHNNKFKTAINYIIRFVILSAIRKRKTYRESTTKKDKKKENSEQRKTLWRRK